MNVIDWILEGDIFIHYLVEKDLMGKSEEDLKHLKKEMLHTGFTKRIIGEMDSDTFLWGGGVYSPKYTSTHYSLLELSEMDVDLSDSIFENSIEILLKEMWINKGQIKRYRHQDMCVTAMMLRIASQAQIKDKRLQEMVDYILDKQMNDGGWNCAWERKPYPKQSSLHTTISVLESFSTYLENGYNYRVNDILKALPKGIEYILTKKLFKSVRTGEIINWDMLKNPFPYGWKYDYMRALYIFAKLNVDYDPRMDDALEYAISRLDNYGRIKADSLSRGEHHFVYTKANKLCPYNTYRILYIFKKYRKGLYFDYINKKIC
jgi:hypothetical protein